MAQKTDGNAPTAPKKLSTLQSLKNGNLYFTSHVLHTSEISNIQRVRYLAENGQSPAAVIITCSDARISPERIFNAEMGDFFIIRTAGNVVGDLELGSVEYAISTFSTDTVIVMGHQNCGAIHDAVYHYDEENIGYIKNILNIIRPSIDRAAAETATAEETIARAEYYNILSNVERVKSSSVIKDVMKRKNVTIVGAEYEISTGKVNFFD